MTSDAGNQRVGEDEKETVVRDGGAQVAEAENGVSARVEPTRDRRGETLGRYVLLEEIGRGGMGVVYKAYDPELDRKVAIKVIRADAQNQREADSAGYRARLLREAQAMAQLAHPNVLPVFDVGTVDGQVFIATEYLDGQTLSEWLRAEDRPWREVVRRLLAAGRGLATAHAAGLVHRDFKPANVLLGKDGSVRVFDFGLVRSTGDAPELEAPAARVEAASKVPSGDRLSDALTDGEVILGTPAYMAPEQHLGADVDARADQYSFCVALYVGLYGQPPFRGQRLGELLAAKQALNFGPVDADRHVPRWLRRVVVRGLEPDPGARWPAMNNLLIALGRDPRRTVLRTGPSVLAVAALVGVFVADWNAEPTEARCTRDASLFATVWSDARRKDLQRKLEDVRRTPDDPTWGLLSARVDQHAEEWLDHHVDACEATHVRGVQSEHLLDRRMGCLDRRRRELKAVLDVIGENTEELRDRAVDMVRQVRGVSSCADQSYLDAHSPPPDRPEQREQVERIHTELAQIHALELAGQLAKGIEVADALMPEVEKLGHPPIRAELLYRRAELERLGGKSDRALELLTEAYFVALESSTYPVAVEAATSLVFVQAHLFQDPEEALKWARHGTALLSKVGMDPLARAALHDRVGVAHGTAGRAVEAEASLRQALAIRIRELGRDHLTVGNTHLNLGWAIALYGDTESALHHHLHALENWERNRGAHNPRLLLVLLNVVWCYNRLGEYDEASKYGEWALSLLESADSSMGYLAAGIHTDVADTMVGMGRQEEALHHYQRSLTLHRETVGDHPYHAETLRGLGQLYRGRGELEKGLESLEASVAMYRKLGDLAAPDVAAALFALGQALWEGQGDRERAVALAREALALLADKARGDEMREIEKWFGAHALGPP